MRKLDTNIHSAYRSLIQKAVRRGSVSLIQRVAYHLYDIGDANWLRRRTAVIAFEECWPSSVKFNYQANFQQIVDFLILVAQSVKVKDATGLGTLAYSLSQGEKLVLSGSDEDYHIRVMSEAIRRPNDFWNWVTTKVSNDNQRVLVDVTQEAYRRGGWPWDKAFIQAAAYLAITENIPNVCFAEQKVEEFPLWVALDKHTPQGKYALREVAKEIRIPYYQLCGVSFYLESAITNESTNSKWWLKEVQWKLHQMGLSYDEARLIWEQAKPLVVEVLKEWTEQLHRELEEFNIVEKSLQENEHSSPVQLTLFSENYHVPQNREPIISEEILKTNIELLPEAKLEEKYVQLELFNTKDIYNHVSGNRP
jgi:hypothetical protein